MVGGSDSAWTLVDSYVESGWENSGVWLEGALTDVATLDN